MAKKREIENVESDQGFAEFCDEFCKEHGLIYKENKNKVIMAWLEKNYGITSKEPKRTISLQFPPAGHLPGYTGQNSPRWQ